MEYNAENLYTKEISTYLVKEHLSLTDKLIKKVISMLTSEGVMVKSYAIQDDYCKRECIKLQLSTKQTIEINISES